jgi:DNA-binding transcriptional LysR family regulator
LLAEFDLLEDPQDEKAPLRGVLSVSASVLFGQLHVVPLVSELLRRHPEVDARLLLLDRIVSLPEESIDVAVRIGRLPDSSLRARLVGHVRWVVCASPAYIDAAGAPRSPDALARHTCIAFTPTTPIPERWSFPGPRGRERSVAVRARLTVNTGQAAIDAAVGGFGLVRVYSYQIGALVAANKLRIVLSRFEPEPVPIHIVQLPGAQTRAAAAFVDLATARLRAKLAESP